ncbi:MAG: DUF4249 family protein, partial [Chitinophagales bacterium]|nr:DUF4249 family protein [Chitinophagales bacterium]
MKWLFILLVISSCEKVSTINLPAFTEQPVMNALLTKDSLLSIHISKAVETNSLEEGNINDALIDVYKNATFFETLSATESGWYLSLNTMVLSGNKYKAVSHTYLGEMMAETFVPTKSEFQINYRIDSAGLDTDGDQFDEISLSIYDDPDNVNFYEIILKVYNIQAAQYNFPFLAALSSDDEVIMREGIQNWGNSLLFSDKGFNGLEKQVLIKYRLNGALDNSGNLIGYD